MKVGICYCGGCNSHYDRDARVKREAILHPDWKMEIAKEKCIYDILLVVVGCESSCVKYDYFIAQRIIKISC